MEIDKNKQIVPSPVNPGAERSITSFQELPSRGFIERILSGYEENPFWRAAAQLLNLYGLPIGGVADSFLVTLFNNMKADRLRTFLEELDRQHLPLSQEQIRNEDFLHIFFITTRVVLQTKQTEKIKLFARLLAVGTTSLTTESVNQYEEYLDILDDLSAREFQVLLTLYRFETETNLQPRENELQRATRFWNDFAQGVERDIRIPRSQLSGFLTRLSRTGLYEPFLGSYIGYSGDKGRLTPNFREFIRVIGVNYNSSEAIEPQDEQN